MRARSRLCITVTALLWAAFRLSAQDREIRTLVGSLGDALSKASKKTVAVVDFSDLQGNVTELGRYLAEEVSVALATTDKGIEVVDRAHLKVLIQENKLNATGIIDPATARKLGQIAGVEVLVTGALTPFGDSVRLAVKALDSSTARIVAAATADIAKTRAIEELLGRSISGSAPTVGGSGSISAEEPSRSDQIQRASEFKFELRACQQRSESVTCEFMVTNQGMDRAITLFGGRCDDIPTSQIVDGSGVHLCSYSVEIDGASSTGKGIYSRAVLHPGVQTIARLVFTGVAAQQAELAVVQVVFHPGELVAPKDTNVENQGEYDILNMFLKRGEIPISRGYKIDKVQFSRILVTR